MGFTTDMTEGYRPGSIGINPAVLVPVPFVSSYSLEITLVAAPMRQNYFSFGISEFPFPSEGSGLFGKHSSVNYGNLGIIDRRNNDEPSEVWFSGRCVGKYRSLTTGDNLKATVNSKYEWSIYINDVLIYNIDASVYKNK